MKPLSFTLALSVFASLVFLTDTWVEIWTSGRKAHAKAEVAQLGSSGENNLLNAYSEALSNHSSSHNQAMAGFDIPISTKRTPLPPAQIAARLEVEIEEKLHLWHMARERRASDYEISRNLDSLTRAFRMKQGGQIVVGVLRMPEGFDSAGFANDESLADRNPTDQVAVTTIAPLPNRAGSRITNSVYNVEAFATAQSADLLPEALKPVGEQIEIIHLTLPHGSENRQQRMRSAAGELEPILKERLRRLTRVGATIEHQQQSPFSIQLKATHKEWEASIQISQRKDGEPVLETIQYANTEKKAP